MRKIFAVLISIILLATFGFSYGCARKEAPQKQQKEQGQQQEKPQQEAAPLKLSLDPKAVVSSAEKPEGCVSCHVKVSEEKDYSLEKEVKNIPGHPQVKSYNIADCMGCHREGEVAFKKILHRGHYEGETYIDNYKGACVHCHKLTEGGQLQIPGLAPQGTTFVTVEASMVDKAPGGCTDCHKKVSEEQDYSLSAQVKEIPNHPPVNSEDYNQCYSCHSEENQFGNLLHNGHLKSDTFKNNYGNSCVNCHRLANDGTVTAKGKK